MRRGRISGIALVLAGLAACFMRVEGDRAAQDGACPEGETCSDLTAEGLTFIGQGLWDEGIPRLGPVLVGGVFEMGVVARGEDAQLPAFAFRIEHGELLSGTLGMGTFGPVSRDGDPVYEVDGFVRLRGLAPGSTTVRVVDPQTGALFDRITLEVTDVTDITLTNVNEPERPHLYAGLEETLGIRLIAGELQMRAIDQTLSLEASGDVQPELMYWDCFSYIPPEGETSVTFTMRAGELTKTTTLAIEPAP